MTAVSNWCFFLRFSCFVYFSVIQCDAVLFSVVFCDFGVGGFDVRVGLGWSLEFFAGFGLRGLGVCGCLEEVNS